MREYPIFEGPPPLDCFDGLDCVAFTGTSADPHYIQARSDLPVAFPPNFVAKLKSGGTAFILGVIPPTINVRVGNKRLTAVVATAGHCAMKNRDPNLYDSELICSFFLGPKSIPLTLIRSFLMMHSNLSADPITRAYYCIPGDIALFGCFEVVKFAELECRGDIELGETVLHVGHTMHLDSNYTLPHCELPDAEKREFLQTLIPANSWICSEGAVFSDSAGYEMTAGSYSASSGCSGGPVFAVKADPYSAIYQSSQQNYSIIGLHVGCAALPYQLKIMQLIAAVKAQDRDKMRKLSKRLRRYFKSFPQEDFLRHDWEEVEWNMKHGQRRSNEVCQGLYHMLYELVSWPSTTSRYTINYNLFLPVTHPIFDLAIRITQELKSQSRVFTTEEQLRQWAKSIV